ncbi:MAG TPA: YbaK/EbsC family protein, partial [Desulfobacteraceae bacterium]|nr:YbaK/EbsC family protein [Desulfobacteraceae bacterium]
MSSSLSDSARRVQEFLTSKGFSFQVRELAGSTRTSREAADRVGCDVGQIAKSLVFREKKSDRPVLVIASGVNRVDLKKIEAATGLKLGRADGNYVKARVGFAIGGVPPAGH